MSEHKISLGNQISELVYELDKRRPVFAQMVARGTMKQSVADYRIACMEAALNTLIWLRDNEPAVRAFVEEKKKIGSAAGK